MLMKSNLILTKGKLSDLGHYCQLMIQGSLSGRVVLQVFCHHTVGQSVVEKMLYCLILYLDGDILLPSKGKVFCQTEDMLNCLSI